MVFATNFFMNMVKTIEQVATEPEVTKIFDLSNVSYTSGGSDYFQLDTSSINPVPRSVAMIDDGSSIYQIEQTGYIERIDMSTSYDISTSSYSGDNVTLTPSNAFHDTWIDETGQNWYFVESLTNGPVYYYTTSTGFDLSGLTKDSTTLNLNTRLQGVYSGGNKIFATGGTTIFQVDVSSGWTNATVEGSVTIQSHSNLVGSVNITNNSGVNITGLSMNSDGTKLITLMTRNSGAICNLVQFTLSSAFDVLGSSTITVENEFDLAAAIPVADRNSSTQGFVSMVIDRDTESHIYLPDVLSDRIFHLKMN